MVHGRLLLDRHQHFKLDIGGQADGPTTGQSIVLYTGSFGIRSATLVRHFITLSFNQVLTMINIFSATSFECTLFSVP